MNRYSRTVTQPKDQGASQVSHSRSREEYGEVDVVHRPCYTPLKVSAVTRTFKKQWLVSLVYGEWLASSSLRDCFIDHDVGMRAIRKAKVHRQWVFG
jgi:hypothetical protein